jgi:hypothetical protein
MSEFVEFPKIARLSRECVITEKIDGTNAQVLVVERAAVDLNCPGVIVGDYILRAGSRNRWLTEDADNFGFAKWVSANAEALALLGPGRHFGEWWGAGIQRRYGLSEKRFSLFNVARWHAVDTQPYVSASADPRTPPKASTEAPACCHVVPVLHRGPFDTKWIGDVLDDMRRNGSVAAPGFMNPEGVVIFHTASGQMFKKTLEKDAEPKSRHVAA